MSNIVVPDDPGRLPWSMTIGELVDKVVSRNPYKVYLFYSEQRTSLLEEQIVQKPSLISRVKSQNYQVTYQEFLEYSLQTASLFRELGVRHGDRVCVFLPNGREFLFIWMGLSRLGAICVPINTAYKQAEMAYILNNAEAKALVSHHTLMEVAQEAAQHCPSLQETLVVSGDGENPPLSPLGKGGQRGVTYPGWKNFWTTLRKAPPLPPQAREGVSPKDISMLVYTSGTTGNPKGVMITHEMYVAAGQGFATWTGATSEERFFTCLPYFHANTQYYSTMGSLALGASLIVTDRFSASRFFDQVRESRATVVNFIGMMMPVLLKQPPADNDRDNSVRIFYGSPAFAPELLEEFEERFGARVLIGFGMTETCYGTIEQLGHPLYPEQRTGRLEEAVFQKSMPDVQHRKGSSGQPRWHPDSRFQNEIRIIDDGAPLPPGKTGEITLRNPAVMPGYWRNEERTREALRDGWLYTGDLGWLDEDGYLYFVDRKKDVVRRRGENISSQEVEDVIKRHPGVLDCAVIAVPSELGEEEVKAYVVPRNLPLPLNPSHQRREDQIPSPSGRGAGGEGEIAELKPEDVVYWCAERLAYFKVPRYVEFREDLPRTPSFRVRKDLLRQERDDLTSGCFDQEVAGIQLRR